MVVQLSCGAILGVDAFRVDLEVDYGRQGMPSFVMVGLAEGAVRESRERVLKALQNSSFRIPPGRITVNLAPADRRKEGSAYDLPLALGLLAAAGILPAECLRGWFFAAELSLDGRLKPVPGVLALAMLARSEGAKGFMVAPDNAQEAAMAEGLDVFAPRTLAEAAAFLAGRAELSPVEPAPSGDEDDDFFDLADVKGQERPSGPWKWRRPARTICCSSASGQRQDHACAAYAGHTSAARSGRGSGSDQNLQCGPHAGRARTGDEASFPHAASQRLSVSIIGGGVPPHPGEVSLAHRGVLFLTNCPSFSVRRWRCCASRWSRESVHFPRHLRGLLSCRLHAACGHESLSVRLQYRSAS